MLLVEPQYAAWSEAEAIPVLERAENGDASAAYQAACYMLSSGDENKRKEAYAWAKIAADSGLAEGCMLVGVCHYEGIGVSRDVSKAQEWFERSYQKGCKRVLNALAYACMEGWDGRKDEKKAWEYVELGVAESVPGALGTMAAFYVEGAGVPVDLSKAKALLQKEIELYPDSGLALYNLAAVEMSSNAQSGGEVERLLLAAADRKYTSAYFSLAQLYLYGEGVARDERKAAMYMHKAVDAGVIGAFCELANMYAEGVGVSRDLNKARLLYQQAIKHDPDNGLPYYEYAAFMLQYESAEMDVPAFEALLKKAAECGHLGAMNGLASEYLDDTGVLPQNLAEFARWSMAAADAGDSHAMLNAGAICLNGIGVEPDVDKAVLYTQKAVEANIPEAYGRMAELYKQGIGVDLNIDKAIDLYRMALQAEPEKGRYYRELALLLMMKSSFDEKEIEALLLKAVELDSQD